MTVDGPSPLIANFPGVADGRPWFGREVAAIQSSGQRYFYQIAAVSALGIKDRPLRVLEIGSWVGASALSWAYAIERFCPAGGAVLCIDPWKAYFDKENVSETELSSWPYQRMNELADSGVAYELFCHNSATGPRNVPIHHFRATSRESLPYLSSGLFDLVYLDGAHDYPNVSYDIAEGRRLVRDGGFLCGDDLELQLPDGGRSIDAALAAQDCIALQGSSDRFHPGVTRAVFEAFGLVSAYEGFWLMRRTANGFDKIDLVGASYFIPPHLANRFQNDVT